MTFHLYLILSALMAYGIFAWALADCCRLPEGVTT